MPLFTKEELEALRLADAELDEEFRESPEEIARSRRMDREAQLDRMDNRERGIAAYQAAYYEANRDKIAAQQAAYREANRNKIAAQQAAYREANRDKIAARRRAKRQVSHNTRQPTPYPTKEETT